MKSPATLWAFAFSASVAAHAAGFAVLSLVARAPAGRHPRAELPESRASGVRVRLVPLEVFQRETAAPRPELELEPEPEPDTEALDDIAAAPDDRAAETAPRLDDVRDELERWAVAGARQAARVARDIRRLAARLTEWAPHEPRARRAPARQAGADAEAAQAPPSSGGSPGVVAAPIPGPENRPPDYPEEARRRRESGTVLLRVTVETDGRVVLVEVTASSGSDLLDQAALEAVRSWRFTPAMENGAAIRCAVDLPVVFLLK